MRNSILISFIMFFALSSAFACIPGGVQLTAEDVLTAEGMYTNGKLEFSIEDLKNYTSSYGNTPPILVSEPNSSKDTFRFVYLGSISDEGGVMQSTYLITDLKSKEQKVTVIKSNYRGNNIRARGIPAADARNWTFSEIKPLPALGNYFVADGCK